MPWYSEESYRGRLLPIVVGQGVAEAPTAPATADGQRCSAQPTRRTPRQDRGEAPSGRGGTSGGTSPGRQDRARSAAPEVAQPAPRDPPAPVRRPDGQRRSSGYRSPFSSFTHQSAQVTGLSAPDDAAPGS